MSNWTKHKIKQRIYIKEYIDIETGEILEEENSKNNRPWTYTQKKPLNSSNQDETLPENGTY